MSMNLIHYTPWPLSSISYYPNPKLIQHPNCQSPHLQSGLFPFELLTHIVDRATSLSPSYIYMIPGLRTQRYLPRDAR